MVGCGVNESESRRVIDARVGGLVWVRRRNGSWWPGQIVGEDELSESGVVSPGSGTPIKLLGRDDASVDWFDLEKTKAVKAFRCGDYDTCIEKAKAAAAKSSKRSSKYPRRENAIIIALEIEGSNLFKNGSDLHSCGNNPEAEPLLNGAKASTSMSHPSKDANLSEETGAKETSTSEEKSNSTQELSHSGISYEETNGSTDLKGQPLKVRRRKTPNDSEDDGCEGIKRMKGLDDLGVGAERKVKVLALANPDPQTSTSLNNGCATNGTSSGSLANGGSIPTLKRKRSQVVHIHELLKRKYRRRPLTKVLENTTMVPVRIICDEFTTPFERSDAISPGYECENGTRVKDAELLNGQLPEDDSSDILFDVPFVDEDLHPSGLSPVWQPSSPLKPHAGTSRASSSRNFQVQTSSLGHVALNGSVPNNSAAAHVNQKEEKSASKWQSKGKRKARHILSKTEEQPNSLKKADVDHDRPDSYAIGLENHPSRFSPGSNGLLINGFTDRRKPISLTSSPRSFSYHHQPRFLIHAGFEIPDVPPRSIFTDSSLYEVEITVEATRPQAQHVPYISLMSKLNGKPITGHPVSVEVLEDGYCDLQVFEYPASGSCELDDEDTEMRYLVSVKKPKARRPKRIKLRSNRSRKKSSKSKKRHGSSSKKTRKLSSLTGPDKLNLEKRKSIVQNPKGPTLACVPLKVVFSRINEALNGSTRSAHRAAATNNT